MMLGSTIRAGKTETKAKAKAKAKVKEVKTAAAKVRVKMAKVRAKARVSQNAIVASATNPIAHTCTKRISRGSSRTSSSLKQRRSRSNRPVVRMAPAARQRRTCCAST